MRQRAWRGIGFLPLLFVLGCERPVGTASVPPPTIEASPLSQEDVQAWIRFRQVYGLRADAAYVASVAADPAASRDPYRVPLLPDELEAVARADSSASTLLPVATAYADDFPEFAGAWLELPRVVIAFTDGLPEREAEATALFGDRVAVRVARFTLKALQASVRAISLDRRWFGDVGAELVDVGVDLIANAVDVHVRWPDPKAEAAIRARFGDTGWMQFSYDGPPPWLGPVGGLRVTVVDAAGQPVAVECLVGTTDPRVNDERIGDSHEGRCFFDGLAAVSWQLVIDYDVDGDRQTIFRTYEVPGSGVVRDTITVTR